MRHRPNQRAETRGHVLDAAGRQFREHGFGGVGVDGLARAAGLTSGAFYGHFRSKAAAFRAVATAGVERLRSAVELFRARRGEAWFDAFAAYYLGAEHRKDVAGGCALPSLSAEVARADDATRADYEAVLKRVATEVAAGLPGAPSREAAWPLLAELAGGVLLSRAVRDEALAAEIAEATLASLRKQAALAPHKTRAADRRS
ncbi:MAG TPA: TetR family transcriptional regulator [Roseiarcus sp.]|nr:TetR family transcriptional regulator [Roseiarcus sp.]